MGSGNYKPAQSGYTRVFLITGMANPENEPEYASYLKLTGLSQSYGEITKIEMPDPNNYSGFIEVGNTRGAKERGTTSLVGRFAAAIKSMLFNLAESGCSIDVQSHIGECTDPSDFNTFTKAIILEDVLVTSYGTDDIGALGSDEAAKIDETAEISYKRMYEVLPLSFATKANDILTNKVVSVTIADTATCGSCGSVSDGCYKIFAVTLAAGGSPSTQSDIIYSIDKGENFYAYDVNSLAVGENPSDVIGIGDYIVVLSNEAGSINYAEKDDFDGGVTVPVFTKVTTGIVTGKEPNAGVSVGRKAFIVGDGGYVYYTDDPVAGLEVLDAGSATVDDLLAVHALDDEYALAVGKNGTVIKTTNRTDWVAVAKPVGAGINLNTCWMRDDKRWLVGTSNGKVYATKDALTTPWFQISLPGTSPSSIKDIKFSSASVGYISAVVGGNARMYRTFDGGNSWTVLPENVGSFPAADTVEKIAVCTKDVNFVVGGGLADDATDGVLIIGSL